METIAEFETVPKMKAAVKAAGNHFFDPGTMRFFNSKIETSLIGRSYFVTSEYSDDPAGRRYTPRYFTRDDDGTYEHHDIGEFMACRSLVEAKVAIENFRTNLRARERMGKLLADVGLKLGTYPPEPYGEPAFIREDGEYLLGDIAPDGSAVELLEGNWVTEIALRDFETPERFAQYVRQQVDAKIADWLAED